MLSRLLKPISEISTHFRCDNCGVLLNQVIWMRCKLCKAFDLCDECAAIPYDTLPYETRADHQNMHVGTLVTKDCISSVSIVQAEEEGRQARMETKDREYERILDRKEIHNDYDMDIVLNHLARQRPSLDNQVNSLITKYHLKARERNIRVLSLDGGGVRGYMSIKILAELITQKYLSNTELSNLNDLQYKQSFHEAQSKFTEQFDYFVGTSTGGLIAFCLAVNYNILDLMEIYSDASRYFKRNYLGPFLYSKYDPSVIHKKIDDIIDQLKLPNGEQLSSKYATLRDIRDLLNGHRIIDEEKGKSTMYKRRNSFEFVDNNSCENTPDPVDKKNNLGRIQQEKILLITAYNTTKNIITIFNTSYAKHWGYRIADVLKATMAAPTYFPPHKMYQGVQTNGYFLPGKTAEVFIDGGVFANDPEVAALWTVRMQWKKPLNYHLLSVGTGFYTSTLSPSTWGGYFAWIFNNGFLVNTLMDATGSFTEMIGRSLAKFRDMRRMKLNYKITKAMALDNPEFVHIFDREWEYLKNEPDFKAFVYFYDKYIIGKA